MPRSTAAELITLRVNVVKDVKENKTAEIHLNDNKLFCSLCRSFSCFHIQFAMATSRVAKLNIESKAIDLELEVDGNKVKKISNRKRRTHSIYRSKYYSRL
ncbi:MAG: hypothetical protein H0W19_03835 [Nitrosopumilus sp.]|nr:hypothetical protein [Nitrosopumilus sp.]